MNFWETVAGNRLASIMEYSLPRIANAMEEKNRRLRVYSQVFSASDDNEFLARHDVVNVEHLSVDGHIVSIFTYRYD